MTLVLQTSTTSLDDVQHIVLDDVSWTFYERLLDEIGDGGVRVTYDEGSIEIMSPLPKHEQWGHRIGMLINAIGIERRIEIEELGSTTFRKAKRQKGLEPDECYYIANADAVRDIEGPFDASMHPPPDLAVEIDIIRRSIPRGPIYAALGVPELWRFDGRRLSVRKLTVSGTYEDVPISSSFPFLPMDEFEKFVIRLANEPKSTVLPDFSKWVRTLG
jgi:Uma2 family endonuclease